MPNDAMQPPPLPNIVIPQQHDVEVNPYQPTGGNMNPGAGFAGKTGQIANIASNFLTGWLAGAGQKRKEKELAAERQIAGSNYAWDMMASQWSNYIQQNGDMAQNAKELQTLQQKQSRTPEEDKRVQELTGIVQQGEQMKKAAHAVWQNRVDTYSKYAFPEGAEGGKQKKGGFKKRMSEGMGAPQPELIAQTLLRGMQGVQDPTSLITVDRNAKLKSDVETEQLNSMRRTTQRQGKIDDAVDAMTGLYAKYGSDESKWTPEQKKEIEAARNSLSIQTKGEPYHRSAEEMKSQLMDDFLSGKEISDEKKQLLGIQVDRPSTFSAQDASGKNYIVSYDPKTKKVTKVDTGIRGRPEESSYQRAMAGYKAQAEITQRMLKQAHPDWSEQQVAQVAAQSMMPANADAGTVEMQNYQRDRALASVLDKQAKAEAKDNYNGAPLSSIWKNFISNPNGQYQFNTQYLKPEAVRSIFHPSTWLSPKEGPLPGGVPKSALPAYESQLRNMVIQELMKENKGMSFAQATRLLGPAIYEREGTAPMAPPPGAPTAFAKPGEKTYTVRYPDGEVMASGIGEAQKRELENHPDMRGVTWVADDVYQEQQSDISDARKAGHGPI